MENKSVVSDHSDSKNKINQDSENINVAMPGFSKNPIKVLTTYLTPLKKLYLISKQSVTSGGIKLTAIYFLGIPLYKSICSSDED